MCCLVQPLWRNCVAPAYCHRRRLCTLSSVYWYSMPRLLTHHSAKHLSNVCHLTTHNAVRCISSSLTTANYELAQCCQHGRSSNRFSSVSSRPITSGPLSSSFCYSAKAVNHQNRNHPNFPCSWHCISRQLTSSTKTIVNSSPLSLQPYLRLIRFDRPIGMPCLLCSFVDYLAKLFAVTEIKSISVEDIKHMCCFVICDC